MSSLRLNADQRRELFEALRGVFVPQDFDRFLHNRLDKRRHEIASDNADFREVLYAVIDEAERDNWLRELVDKAIEERSTDEALRNFTRHFPAEETGPPAPPTYAHILFISARGETTAHGPCDTGSEPPSQQIDLIRAEAGKQQADDQALLVSEVKDWGVVIATFGDAGALLKCAIHVAKTVNSPGVGRPRMGLHSVERVNEAPDGRPPKAPREWVEMARRVTQLGNQGHILATCDAAEHLKAGGDFEAVFGEGFNVLFHGPLKCELRPSLDTDIYNVYLKSPDGNGQQTVFGNESIPRTKVPEGVIKEVQVPRTIRVLRAEKIRVVFCDEVSYAKVKFEFEDVAGSNIRISCEQLEGEDCAFECDFEDPHEVREHFFNLQAINAKRNHNFLLRMLCHDRRGEPIIRPREWPIRLRRSFWLWLWDVIRQWLADKIWRKPWYDKAAQLGIAVGVAVLLYLLISWCIYKPPPPPPPPKPEPFVGSLSDDFTEEEAKTLTERWDFTGGQAEVIDEELLVKGPGMVLYKFPKSKVLYDFTVRFKFVFVKGTRAAWVLRAQPDKSRGYIFVLRQSGKDLYLEGYKEANLKEKIDPQVRRVNIECCDEKDTFLITAVVKGGTINYDIVVSNPKRRDGVNREGLHSFEFTVDGNPYPYGSAGFVGLNDSEIQVLFWFLNPPRAGAGPAATHLSEVRPCHGRAGRCKVLALRFRRGLISTWAETAS